MLAFALSVLCHLFVLLLILIGGDVLAYVVPKMLFIIGSKLENPKN
jgi:hypothetical protein